MTPEQAKRIDELQKQPCRCEELPHMCDRCKELADLLNPRQLDANDDKEPFRS